MGTRERLFALAFLISLCTAAYHLLGRERLPTQLVEVVDASSDGYSRLETAVGIWLSEQNEGMIKLLIRQNKDEPKEELSEQRNR
jgi:hypothetical protein